MDMIYYRGLSCYIGCLINIANIFGINYNNAFHSLWSEMDFTYEKVYGMCTSKRLIPNLEALGISLNILPCNSQDEAVKSFHSIPDNGLFLIGMDTFHIPWSIVYEHFHGYHYIFALKHNEDYLYCFDPTYNKEFNQVPSKDIISTAFDLTAVYKTTTSFELPSISDEVWSVIQNHPSTLETFCTKISECKEKKAKEINPLIRQIAAMIDNRHLFQHFLKQHPCFIDCNVEFFNNKFFSKWDAIKNGLYKATIVKDNRVVVDCVYDLFLNLMNEEMDMAKEMIGIEYMSL